MSFNALNETINEGAGRAQRNAGISLATFLASLSSAALCYVTAVIAFVVLRGRFRSIYKPRTSPIENAEKTPPHRLSRLFDVLAPVEKDWRNLSIDAYYMIHFPRVIAKLLALLSCILPPILLPLNYSNGVGQAGGVTGLDQFSWANVKDPYRLWAHLLCALIAIGCTCLSIRSELNHFIGVRRDYLLSEEQILMPVHSTVLVTDIPSHLMAPCVLKNHYEPLFGSVIDIQPVLDLSKIASIEQKRRKLVLKLEEAWTDALRHSQTKPSDGLAVQPKVPLFWRLEKRTRKLLAQLQNLDRRVLDAFDELRRHQLRTRAALLLFENPVVAHKVCQVIMGIRPGQFKGHLLCTGLSEVFFSNLGRSEFSIQLRRTAALTMIPLLAIFWTIPITFAGCLSQVSYLSRFSQIATSVASMPASVRGLIQGVLPQTFLSAVMSIYPLILRPLLRGSGRLTAQLWEIDFQNHYFAFLILQVFFTVSISSGLTTVIPQVLTDSSSLVSILAHNLPKASNYFLSFLLLDALMNAALILTQAWRVVKSIMARVRRRHCTARQVWEQATDIPKISSGMTYSYQAAMVCIVLIYSVSAPIILPLGCVAFTILWLAQRYLMTKVAIVSLQTAGATYQRIFTCYLFVGIYIMGAYLIGLFALERDKEGKMACLGQMVVMAVTIIITAFYQVWLNRKYQPMLRYLSADSLDGRKRCPNVEADFRLESQGPQHQVVWVPVNDSDLLSANSKGVLSKVVNRNVAMDMTGQVQITGQAPVALIEGRGDSSL